MYLKRITIYSSGKMEGALECLALMLKAIIVTDMTGLLVFSCAVIYTIGLCSR